MSGFATNTTDHLVRSNVWSTQLKEVLQDELMGMKYVDIITEFPDGNTINIPSIGQAEVRDYAEGQEVVYTAMDTGNFSFSIDQYKSSATYITNKMKQDAFYTDRLIASFVPGQSRAIMTAMEAKILSVGPDGQTASNSNTINGAKHRFVAAGTNQVVTLADFAKAYYALQKANVPLTNLVAIVDPSVEFTLATLSNLTNVSNNPKWEGIVNSNITTGMKFIKNVYGFDVYGSNFVKSGISETIDSVSVTNGAANLFFSATPGVLPVVGLVRQAPTVDSEYNKDMQREEYVTTCRYGFGFYRPENMVTVISDTSRVYS